MPDVQLQKVLSQSHYDFPAELETVQTVMHYSLINVVD